MALSALLATTSIFRSVPIMASVVMHAGVAATLIATGGHAPTRPASSIAETLDIDVTTETPVTPPQPEQETPSANVASPAPAPPTHTHPFPVDPSHDAHPHDPSQPHDHATPDTHAHEEPAAAAPVTTSEAPLPRFTIPSGAAQNAPGGATSGASTGASTGSASASAPADDAVVPASSVQVAAKLQSSVVAAYPVDARADDVEGDVQLEIVVDREGRVVEARVARPAGHGFDEAALQAIRRYRFSPAQREGRNVRVRMPWSVQFRLR